MLNFREVSSKVRVVAVENKGSYSSVKFKTARKDKKTDEWINSTWNFIRFLATANEKIDEIVKELDKLEKFDNGDVKSGVPIVLKSVSLENAPYTDKDGKKQYPKNYSMIVWNWEFPKDEVSDMDIPPVIEEPSSDELPF